MKLKIITEFESWPLRDYQMVIFVQEKKKHDTIMWRSSDSHWIKGSFTIVELKHDSIDSFTVKPSALIDTAGVELKSYELLS